MSDGVGVGPVGAAAGSGETSSTDEHAPRNSRTTNKALPAKRGLAGQRIIGIFHVPHHEVAEGDTVAALGLTHWLVPWGRKFSSNQGFGTAVTNMDTRHNRRTGRRLTAKPASDEPRAIQLALYGEPVPVDPTEPLLPRNFHRIEQDPLEGSQVREAVDAFAAQLETLFDAFAPKERTAAARGLYLDADGWPRARYRLLRAI